MKILSVVGARPQFIKAAAVSCELRKRHREILVHTGQHYDANMSSVFFTEMAIPRPDYNLKTGSGSHAEQLGRIMVRLERVLLAEKPDWVLVYGDTNSTLAGAVVASRLHIPVAHVEAGLRSFNRRMPEEHNRVLTDHCSDLLLCPSREAVKNLRAEGLRKGVHLVGDVMYDAVLRFGALARERSRMLSALGLAPKGYALATVHRAENTDDAARLRAILDALSRLDMPAVLPLHPRTRARLSAAALRRLDRAGVRVIPPAGYLDMLALEQAAALILTDSGGIQKEAYWLRIPCVTLREETEWIETVKTGWNTLAGADRDRIVAAARRVKPPRAHPLLYGKPGAAARCSSLLETALPRQRPVRTARRAR